MARGGGQRGQASVEWLALVLLMGGTLIFLLVAFGAARLSLAMPVEIAGKLVCAVQMREGCGEADPLSAEALGDEIADLLVAHSPKLLYERGMRAVPVDFRRCREDACAEGPESGDVDRSDAGERVVAFTHAIDCRAGSAAETEASGADCSGARAGNLYLQWWFYYPGSATAEGSTPLKGTIRAASTALGKPSYHPDDWESYQLRIEPDGDRFARASSHHGYVYETGGPALVPGLRVTRGAGGRVAIARRPQVVNDWGPDTGVMHISGGSHAGRAGDARPTPRSTRPGRLVLVPLREAAAASEAEFAVVPPWLKKVYFDPESAATD